MWSALDWQYCLAHPIRRSQIPLAEAYAPLVRDLNAEVTFHAKGP